MFTNISRPSAVDVLRPFVVGDIFTADTTTTLAKVADVAVGNVLLSGGVGVIPAWGKVTLSSHVTGVLPAINGGTGINNGTNNLTVPATGTAALLATANVFSTTQTVTMSAANTFAINSSAGNAVIVANSQTGGTSEYRLTINGTTAGAIQGNLSFPFVLRDAVNGANFFYWAAGSLATGVMNFQATMDAANATTAGAVFASGVGIAKNLIGGQGRGTGVTSTATAAGTTTLTSASDEIQTFTGSTTQTINFPAANLFGAGVAVLYTINNQSSGTVTPTRAGADTFQGGGTTDPVLAGASQNYASNGVSLWMKV